MKGRVESLYLDGHSPDFFVKKISETRLELLSAGRDYSQNTSDDISFGFVTLD